MLLTRLRGGSDDQRQKDETSRLSRIIRWAALGLHAWAYAVGYVSSVTILSPPLPGLGKLPYTIQLPPRGATANKKLPSGKKPGLPA